MKVGCFCFSSVRCPFAAMVLIHMVWFKCKEDATQEQMQALINGAQMLRNIPGVVDVKAGATQRLLAGSGQTRVAGFGWRRMR